MTNKAKKEEPVYEMLSQCPMCLTIEVDVGQRVPVYHNSMVYFPRLPQKPCMRHRFADNLDAP